MNGYNGGASRISRQPFWIVVIITSGVCLSTYFACVTPFAALATLAALNLEPRHATLTIVMVWLANQAVGYGLLDYPWNWESAAWGLAILFATFLATISARALSTTRSAPLRVSLPFVAAFAMFELSLYVAGLALPGGEAAFSASVIGHVFLINSIALCCLMGTYRLYEMSASGDDRTVRMLNAPS